MHVKITKSEIGSNSGSCAQLVQYLEKENKDKKGEDLEHWFNHNSFTVKPYEVRQAIDRNIGQLMRKDEKFYLLNVSPSEKEIKFLKARFGNSIAKEKFKEFAREIMDEYAKNFNRPGILSGKDLVYFGKFEENRSYKANDAEVIDGIKKRGEIKEGENWHVQIIVSRKDASNKIKLSPMNSSKGRNKKHSSKFGEFNRVNLKHTCEKMFDSKFSYERGYKESFEYVNIMKNGSIQDRVALMLNTQELLVDETIEIIAAEVDQNPRNNETEVKRKRIRRIF